MVNPKDTAAALADQLEAALAQLVMPGARRRELEEFHATAQELAKRIEFFHEEHVVLDLRDSRTVFEEAYQQWAVLEPGTIDGPILDRIVTLSQPLGRLHRAGIDIRSCKKFTAVETSFARLLGDNFAALARGWEGLKKVIGRPNPDFRFQRQYLATARRFLDALQALGMFSVVGFEYSIFGPATDGRPNIEWKPLDVAAVPKNLSPKALLRAKMRPNSPAARPLVTGEWLNAYAANLVHDHLRRNDMPHEIYTNVRYSAPAEIINVSGDFDVIVQSGDNIAVFECKSGPLDPRRNDFASTIEKAAGLQRVIDKTGAEVALTSVLLYNPSATARETVEVALAGTGIRALEPDQVRGFTIELFRAD